MTIAITQYTRWGDCHHLRESWNSLAMSQEGTHPFQLFEWHDAWYRAYGEQRNVSVWCGTQDGQLVALLPLINSRIELGRIPYPAAVLMGGENAASDYLT
ncbi:MAG: hypothetical protein KDD60_09340, partial [Bdellovibrionales bacterium]|nr:hypothetical protein [Bdellovibrionales bacterium]